MKAVYIPNDQPMKVVSHDYPTMIRVNVNDTFTAAHALHRRGFKTCCLNFASHKRPGGGYKGKAKAQEEDLFRRSNLPNLMDNKDIRKFYPLHSGAIYCPTVTVTKDARLQPNTNFETSVISMPAPNDPQSDEDRMEYFIRANRILEIAANFEHEYLVLGAWGCGVFKNDPVQSAHTWNDLIHGKFKGVFKGVAFVILGKKENYEAFSTVIAREG